ncbi:CD1247 N-terminal domain-containing protein [Caloranaerobacter sp. DY30410]|uniref:CD1247 N-terminal domain-containing protein n=1 Tax=Caloranaerobacter sp. DY30410 TaxID=3238305 RepID=UPI003D03FF7B
MDYLYEKIAYLRGLAEGLDIDESTKEGKLLMHIIDTLEDFSDAINELYEEQAELEEYVDAVDEDLTEVEDELFGEMDEDDFAYDEEDDDIDYVEIQCPNCNEIIYFERDLLDEEEEAECPNCHATIELKDK